MRVVKSWQGFIAALGLENGNDGGYPTLRIEQYSSLVLRIFGVSLRVRERTMPKILLMLAAAFMIVFTSVSVSFVAKAADTLAPRQNRNRVAMASRYCQDLWRCGPNGSCNWYHVCTRRCPDGYSCYPLYGAYGPYGGVAYWGGYTDSGWSYR